MAELKTPEYRWPSKADSTLIGTSPDRIDGLPKSTGAAKYSYDINLENMLFVRALSCPHAYCTVKSIDLSAAEKIPGVVAVKRLIDDGKEIRWEGEPVVAVAAESEAAAAEGCQAVKVEYDVQKFFVDDSDVAAAEKAGQTKKAGGNVQLEKEPPEGEDEDAWADKEIERLLKESAAVVEAEYGIQAITHMCLETHGSTAVWENGKLTSHLSTQNVSGTAGQLAGPLKITADDVTVHCDYIGGGFGSKFAADWWGVVAAEFAKETGRPVKFMLTREQDQKIAGQRPSGFIRVAVGADKDGVVKVWDSHHWGSSGYGGGGVSQDVIPYVFNPPNRRRRGTAISINAGPARAWRAPNHPQGCAITHTAYDDIAAKLGLDSYDVFLKNLPGVANEKAELYAKQMEIGAKLIDWKAKWHPHGKGKADGSVVSGLGMALHTWGGAGHNSKCLIKIHPDGGVECFLGSQDLGTGTRTVIGMVIAETFGLPLDAVKVNIGSSKYPASGPSGGSTTVAGVSESSRRAGQDALEKLTELVGKKLDVDGSTLVAKDGKIQTPDGKKSVSWKEACSLLGMNALEVTGEFKGGKSPLSSAQVGGIQMAEVAVDRETGVVKMKKFVAVQDMGLVINRKTAASQIYGAVCMGIAYALFEERIMDAATGAFINAGLAHYKLPRLGDIGDIVVEIYEPEEERQRGVIGLGEPPVISPGAAISNAVCNALGVRVPVLPMTPQRVLGAIEKARKA